MKLHTVPAPLQADPSFRGRIRRIWPNWERSTLRLKKGESKMQRNTSKRTLVALFCLLALHPTVHHKLPLQRGDTV
jgi:hypothetical protein